MITIGFLLATLFPVPEAERPGAERIEDRVEEPEAVTTGEER